MGKKCCPHGKKKASPNNVLLSISPMRSKTAATPTVQFKGFALELNGAAARIWGNEAPKQNCGLPTTTAIPCGGGKPPLRSLPPKKENMTDKIKEEEKNNVVQVKVVDVDKIPKYQAQISIAIFCGLIGLIATGIFMVLSEYFEIKSNIDKLNYTLTDVKEEQSELENIIENGKFILTPEKDLAYDIDYTELDCKIIKEKIAHLEEVNKKKKCDK